MNTWRTIEVAQSSFLHFTNEEIDIKRKVIFCSKLVTYPNLKMFIYTPSAVFFCCAFVSFREVASKGFLLSLFGTFGFS